MRSSNALVQPKKSLLAAFFVIEIICIGGFLVFMSLGQGMIAWAFLVGPLQILAWAVLVQNSYFLILVMAFVGPLAFAEMIPRPYHRFVFYPSIIFLLILLRFTAFMDEQEAHQLSSSSVRERFGQLAPFEKIPAVLLAIWIIVSFGVAALRGRVEPFFVTCNIFVLEVFFVTYFFAVVPQNTQQVRALIIATAIGNLICALTLPWAVRVSVGVAESIGGKMLSAPFGILDLNAFGALLATSSVAILGLIIGEKKLGRQLLLGLLIIILLVALVFTRSRGAWFGLGVALIYLLLRSRALVLAVLSGMGGLLIIISDFFRNMVLSRLASTSLTDPSLSGRLVLWMYAWLAVKNNWLFGVGWENFRFIKFSYGYPKFGDPRSTLSTHNLYIETMVDLGFLGLALFLFLLIGTIIRTNRLVKNPQQEEDGLALGIAAALIAYASHSVFDSLSSTFMVFGMWLGLAMALRRLKASQVFR